VVFRAAQTELLKGRDAVVVAAKISCREERRPGAIGERAAVRDQQPLQRRFAVLDCPDNSCRSFWFPSQRAPPRLPASKVLKTLAPTTRRIAMTATLLEMTDAEMQFQRLCQRLVS
jgi:hypothetical protein